MAQKEGMEGTKKPLFGLAGGADRKKLELWAAIVIIAIVLLIYFSSFAADTGGEKEELPTSYAKFQAEGEEARLRAVLSTIKGAGDVEVMITFEGSAELIPAFDSNITSTSTDESDSDSVRTSRSENETQKPSSNNAGTVMVAEKRPDVLGVIVIAQGADDISVRMQLMDAVQTVLNVAPNKVGVYVMQ